MDLLSVAQKFLVGKSWNSETVLRMGVELLSVANLLPNLSFQDKTSLVCQTILRMLDGVEKVGKEHSLESIAIMPTTAQLEQCKNLVKTLPLILELVNTGLSRPVPAQCVPRLQSCLPLGSFSWGCMRNQVVENMSAVEDLVKHPQNYLEEMRGLVSKVEKLLSSSEAVAVAVPVAEPVSVPEPEAVAEHVTVVPEAVAEPEAVTEHVTVVSEPEPVTLSLPESVSESVLVPVTVSLPSAEPTPELVPSAFSAAAESLLEPRSVRLPPSPVSSDEQLPGGLATPEEVALSQ